MALTNASYLRGFYEASRAHGAPVINSDFTFEIEGFESSYLLTKQCPWPVMRPQGEIEVPSVLGMTMFMPQQTKVADQGPIAFHETVAGTVDKMMIDLLTSGKPFAAKIYEGTPQKFLRWKRIVDCFIVLDNPDRDWENRSQPLMFSGTLFYHYFGEMQEGGTSY